MVTIRYLPADIPVDGACLEYLAVLSPDFRKAQVFPVRGEREIQYVGTVSSLNGTTLLTKFLDKYIGSIISVREVGDTFPIGNDVYDAVRQPIDFSCCAFHDWHTDIIIGSGYLLKLDAGLFG